MNAHENAVLKMSYDLEFETNKCQKLPCLFTGVRWTLSYDLIMYCKLHGSGTFINSCVRDKI